MRYSVRHHCDICKVSKWGSFYLSFGALVWMMASSAPSVSDMSMPTHPAWIPHRPRAITAHRQPVLQTQHSSVHGVDDYTQRSHDGTKLPWRSAPTFLSSTNLQGISSPRRPHCGAFTNADTRNAGNECQVVIYIFAFKSTVLCKQSAVNLGACDKIAMMQCMSR